MKKLWLLLLAMGVCSSVSASGEDSRQCAAAIDAMLAVGISEALSGQNIFNLIRMDKINELDQLLTRQPGLINSREDDLLGLHPIHVAGEHGNLGVMRVLLHHGANVLAPDYLGQTAFARCLNFPELTRFLIDHLKQQGLTATALQVFGRIIQAVVEKGSQALENNDQRSENKYADLLGLLLDQAGINVDAQNFDGETALHIAAKRGYVKAVRRLLIARARIDLQDQSGRTVIGAAGDCTDYRQKEKIVQLIRGAENLRNARSILQNAYNRTIPIEIIDLIIESMGMEPIQEQDERSFPQRLLDYGWSFIQGL